MIRFEIQSNDDGKCIFETSGSLIDIETEAAYMIALIYKSVYRSDPAVASKFRELLLHAINGAFDGIERGDV